MLKFAFMARLGGWWCRRSLLDINDCGTPSDRNTARDVNFNIFAENKDILNFFSYYLLYIVRFWELYNKKNIECDLN